MNPAQHLVIDANKGEVIRRTIAPDWIRGADSLLAPPTWPVALCHWIHKVSLCHA
jgi:hypothetical protein